MTDLTRGKVALVIGVGEAMDPEWESSDMTKLARRATSAAIPYLHGKELSIIYYGSTVRVNVPVPVVDFIASGMLSKPDCGLGANLSGALHGALSQRADDELMTIIVLADMDVDKEELARAQQVIRHAPNVQVVIVRTATDADGKQAHELDDMATSEGGYDNVELVQATDGRGRPIDHDLETCIHRRLEVLGGRRLQHSRSTGLRSDASVPTTV